MAYLRDRVIVLKKEPYREQDRRYTLYGKEFGLLVAVARGSSVRTSKQAGHLEPFSECEVMIAKGSAFDKLAVARMVQAAQFESQLAAFAVAGAFSHLLVRLLRPGIADEGIFEILRELIATLSGMPQEPTPERARLVLAAATLHLLDALGFAPAIGRQGPGTSLVPSLSLVAFIRRVSLADILRVTAPVDVLCAACAFIEEGVEQTPLEREPHGVTTLQALLV